MKDIILNSALSYDKILSFFDAKPELLSPSYNHYKTALHNLFFFREIESNEIACFVLDTISMHSVYELMYMLSESHEGEKIGRVINEISKIEGLEDPFLNISEAISLDEMATFALDLSYLEDRSKLNVQNPEVFFQPPFENKLVEKDSTVYLPIINHGQIVNLVSLSGKELNTNAGTFSATLLPGCNTIAVFLQVDDLMAHADQKIARDYFYVLFSKSLQPDLITRLFELSKEKDLPISFYLPEKRSLQAHFCFIQSMLAFTKKPFESIVFEENESLFKLHFYASNEKANIMQLVEFIQLLNRRLIILYNGEMAVVEEDISYHLNLIKTETKRHEDFIAASISFAANNQTLAVVLTEIFQILKKPDISFNLV